MNTDQKFLKLVEDVLINGDYIDTRNAKVVRSTNKMLTFDSTPLVGIRKTAWKNALREWEWFMSGSNNIEDLHSSVRSWWEPWAGKYKNVYNNYSMQLRHFHSDEVWGFDQIQATIQGIKDHPYSRRLVLTTWNPWEMQLDETPITNCHGTVIQFFVGPDNKLSMTMYQRSCDLMLGVPHNWIQYWAFLQYMAHVTGRLVGSFTWIGGDVHVYNSHIEMAYRMIKYAGLTEKDGDTVVPNAFPKVPNLEYNPTSESFLAEDFVLDAEYEPVFKDRLKMEV